MLEPNKIDINIGNLKNVENIQIVKEMIKMNDALNKVINWINKSGFERSGM